MIVLRNSRQLKELPRKQIFVRRLGLYQVQTFAGPKREVEKLFAVLSVLEDCEILCTSLNPPSPVCAEWSVRITTSTADSAIAEQINEQLSSVEFDAAGGLSFVS